MSIFCKTLVKDGVLYSIALDRMFHYYNNSLESNIEILVEVVKMGNLNWNATDLCN